jgi:hypothetical protein
MQIKIEHNCFFVVSLTLKNRKEGYAESETTTKDAAKAVSSTDTAHETIAGPYCSPRATD